MSQSIVRVSDAQIERAHLLLRGVRGGAPKALARAINRSVQNARSNMVRSVREEYTAKAKAIRETISISKASSSNLEAVVKSVSPPLPLRDFQVSPKTQNGKRRSPIRVAIKKGRKTSFDRTFVVRTGGSINVFERVGKSRLPIKKLFGPSVPQMIGNEKVITRISYGATAVMGKRLDHEINRLLEGGR